MATATAPTQVAAAMKIPTMDGWRGIAILMVLADHIVFAASHDRYPREPGCTASQFFLCFPGS